MATEKRLIDANRYGRHLADIQLTNRGWKDDICEFLDYLMEFLDEQPTVDAVEVVHGRWLYDSGSGKYFCSACDSYAIEQLHRGRGGVRFYEAFLTDYCPNCGADMRDGDGNG